MEILLNTATTERRAALRENGKITEIFLERPDEQEIVGSIYKARVKDVLPGMQAAFVDIGREKKGFLYRDELVGYKRLDEPYEEKEKRSISEFITEGQVIIVQVTKEEFGEKGARLTENVSLPGKYTVYLPEGTYIGVSKKMEEENRETWRTWAKEHLAEEEGVIIRTVCETLPEETVAEDLRYLREDWEEMVTGAREKRPPSLISRDGGMITRLLRDYPPEKIQQIIVDHFPDVQRIKRLLRYEEKDLQKVTYYQGKENLFSVEGVDKVLERALKPKVWLKNGGFLMIEKTEALTVIDVNTGRYTGRDDLAETIRKTNLEAVQEITAQLRLRDISGIIVIDFIDMKKEAHKEEVMALLQHALDKDRTKTNVAGMSTLGLVEMTRKKVRRGLEESLFQPCDTCFGTGRLFTEEALAYQAERFIHEHREMEAEAMVLEVPKRVYQWLYDEGSLLLKTWSATYPFAIYLVSTAEKDEIAIRFTGNDREARNRRETLENMRAERD